jgi:hypothetical protein
VFFVFIVAAASLASVWQGSPPPAAAAASPTNDEAAKAAFAAAYPVFVHPRCLNCHPAADVPLQGEDSRRHAQNVQRGSDGKGKPGLRCTDCHQPDNIPGENMPPGVANWHMPPADMKMVFQGRSAGELCRQLKDPQLNGGRSADDAIEHLETDPLVLWGWSPGEGRSTPPLSHGEFVRRMHEWLQNGAACPE